MESLESVEKQLRRLEELLLQPEVRKSPEKVADLLEDDFLEFGGTGKIYNKSEILEELLHEPEIQMTLTNYQIRLLATNVILATFHLCTYDKQRDERIYSLRCSIWRLTDGKWKVIFHQGTPTEAPME